MMGLNSNQLENIKLAIQLSATLALTKSPEKINIDELLMESYEAVVKFKEQIVGPSGPAKRPTGF
ncbi:MAG: hypothetical protein WC799_00490 [Desulfobacteraceae bacterium]|jgi:hypothetical protein